MLSYETRTKYRNNILSSINLDQEIWFNHMRYYTYAVSNFGRVKNITTNRILKGNKNPQGYTMLSVRDNNQQRKHVMLHRLVAETIIPCSSQLHEVEYEVNHINSNKEDNTIQNLEWVTRRENLDHAVQTQRLKGLQSGEKNGRNKLKDTERQEIVYWYTQGDKIKDIAKAYNIGESSVYRLTLNHKRKYNV